MISCEMMGRLGNQMFIAAAAHSLAIDNDDEVVFPDFLTGIVPTDKQRLLHLKTIFRKLKYTDDLSFVKHVYNENPDHSHSLIPYKKNMFLRGYFQSEKYFKHNRDKILEFFEPLPRINEFLNKKYCKLVHNKDVVSIHIRRGDYLELTDYHAVTGKDFYDKAMKEFSDNHTFVFFSDDIEWCKKTFKGNNNIFIEKQDDVLDLYLMSKITNNIIANSSFSWWAAWMNKNEDKKVIAPSVWFGPKNSHLNKKDLIPEEWQIL